MGSGPEATDAGASSDERTNSRARDSQSPGKLLAAGRKARELTVDEVGDALNLAPQTVQALEADDFTALPAAAFTQGYIRNYAKHVGLDADAVVGAYQTKAGKPSVEWESPRTAAGLADIVQRHPGVLITAVVAAVVLLIVVTLVLVWPDEAPDDSGDALGIDQGVFEGAGESQTMGTERAGAIPPGGASGSAGSEGSVSAGQSSGNRDLEGQRFDSPDSRSLVGERDFDRDAIDPNDPLAHLPLAKTYPASAVDSSGGNTLSAEGSASTDSSGSDSDYQLTVNRRLTPEGDDRIRVEVSQDCWVGISSVQGRSLFGMLARPGQTLDLTGAGPFRVKLGYTAGVELFFNDNPVLLEPYTRNDVASLVIGQ